MDNEEKYYQFLDSSKEVDYYYNMLEQTEDFIEDNNYSNDLEEIENSLRDDLNILYSYIDDIQNNYIEKKTLFYDLHGEKKTVDSSDQNYDKYFYELSNMVYQKIDSCREILDKHFKKEEKAKKELDKEIKKEAKPFEEEADAMLKQIHEEDKRKDEIEKEVNNIMNSLYGKIDKTNDKLGEVKQAYKKLSEVSTVLKSKTIDDIDSSLDWIDEINGKFLNFKSDLMESFDNKKSIIFVKYDKNLTNIQTYSIHSTDKDYLKYYDGQLKNYDYILNYFDGLKKQLQIRKDYLLKKENKSIKENDIESDTDSDLKDSANEKKDLPNDKSAELDIDRIFRTAKYKSKNSIEKVVELSGGYEQVWHTIEEDLKKSKITNYRVLEFVEDLKDIYSEEELKNILPDKYLKTEEDNSFETLSEDPMKHHSDKKQHKGFFDRIKESISKTFGGEKPKGKKVKRKKMGREKARKLKRIIEKNKNDILVVALTNIGMAAAGSLVNAINENSVATIGKSSSHKDEKTIDVIKKKTSKTIEKTKETSQDILEDGQQNDISNSSEENSPIYENAEDAVNGDNPIEPSEDVNYLKVAAFDTETGEWILLDERQLNDEEYMRNLNIEHGGRLAQLLGKNYGSTEDNIKNGDGWIPVSSDKGGRSR